MLARMQIKETFIHCWWEHKLAWSLLKSVWEFLIKMEIGLPQDAAKPVFVILTKNASSYCRDACSTMFITILFIIDRN